MMPHGFSEKAVGILTCEIFKWKCCRGCIRVSLQGTVLVCNKKVLDLKIKLHLEE